jgi:hypothetical protein
VDGLGDIKQKQETDILGVLFNKIKIKLRTKYY